MNKFVTKNSTKNFRSIATRANNWQGCSLITVGFFLCNITACSTENPVVTVKKNFSDDAISVIFSTNAHINQYIQDNEPLNVILKPRTNTLIVYVSENSLQLKKAFLEFKKTTHIDITLVEWGSNDAELLANIQAMEQVPFVDAIVLQSKVALNIASEKDLLQSITSKDLQRLLPNQYRNYDKGWFGLAYNPRKLVYNKKIVDIGNVENLSQISNWQDKLCFSKLDSPKNIILLSAMMKKSSNKNFQKSLETWKKYSVHSPYTNDVDILKGIQSGKCAMAFISENVYVQQKNRLNTDIIIQHTLNKSQQPINLMGVGVAKYSTNPLKALQMVEYLTTDDAQILISAASHTRPVTKTFLNKQEFISLDKQTDLEQQQQQKITKQQKTNPKRNPKRKTLTVVKQKMSGIEALQQDKESHLSQLQSIIDTEQSVDQKAELKKLLQQTKFLEKIVKQSSFATQIRLVDDASIAETKSLLADLHKKPTEENVLQTKPKSGVLPKTNSQAQPQSQLKTNIDNPNVVTIPNNQQTE